MSLIPTKKQKTVADIVAPIGKIVADLRALAARENEGIEDRKMEIQELEVQNTMAQVEADRAEKLAAKYEGLIA